jgi:archaellum biogenesis protein FlaJ (TadC family)
VLIEQFTFKYIMTLTKAGTLACKVVVGWQTIRSIHH